jgi:peptide/nickel transport system permease protein
MTPLQQNLAILSCVALFGWIATAILRSERWERPRARLLRDRVGLASLAVIGIYILIGLSNLIIVPADGADGRPLTLLDLAFQGVPIESSYSAPLAGVSEKGKPLAGWHLLGTDVLGKDVLQQTMKGASTALLIGGLTSLIYIPIGVLLGIASGYYKRRIDDIVQYLYSTVACIPNILLLISILVVLGKGIPQMAFALGLTGWVGMCRLLRGETLRQSERPYCEAARALGQRGGTIIVRHILPNVMHLVLINFILGFSGIVLAESILSYIGVGMPIGTPSWGAMIDSARMELVREPKVWWNLGAASTALFIFVLSLNLFGDALRKAFDPKAA